MFHSYVFYDTAAETPIQGADANTSLTAPAPMAVQIDAVASGTTVKIQSRLHASAGWHDEGSYTNTDGNVLLAFAVPRAEVRVIRSAGTGAVKAYAQR